MKHFLRMCSVLGLFVVVSTGAWGQSTGGAIQGTVVDPSGATLPGATVTARNMGTGVTSTATTTSAGVYALPNLPPGSYVITVEATGMKKYVQEGITVSTNSTVGLDLQLQLGSATETVTVTSDATQLETGDFRCGIDRAKHPDQRTFRWRFRGRSVTQCSSSPSYPASSAT